MTIAETRINLRLAATQGWTKEEVESELNDILTALQERVRESHGLLVEFTTEVSYVNADPFNDRLGEQLKKLPPTPLSGSAMGVQPTSARYGW